MHSTKGLGSFNQNMAFVGQRKQGSGNIFYENKQGEFTSKGRKFT